MSWESFDLAAKLRVALSASRLDCSSSSYSSSSSSPSFLSFFFRRILLCFGISWDPPSSSIDGILEDLDHVDMMWRMVKAKIADAEAREIPEEPIRLWLRQLRDLSYMMEDVHDLYEYQLAANQVSLQHGRSQDEKYLPLEDPCFWKDVADRVVNIKECFDDIARMKNGLSLGEDKSLNVHDDDSCSSFTSRPHTGSSLPESKLTGRDDNTEELSKLLKTEHGDESVQVIALVGIGGVGKTSLAQHAFQHFKGTKQFDTMAWVFVSEHFNPSHLLKAALVAFTKEDVTVSELSVLQEKLENLVSVKKFFLVMDDIWNRNSESWATFFAPFKGGKKGSKILITTREKDVARTAGAVSFIKLDILSEKDGWSLLQQNAFTSPRVEHPPELVDIGKDIVKKCGGLPLAIKVIGRSLRDKNYDEWRHVLESNLWDVVQNEHGQQILGPLYFSYLRLPTHLKTCFRFCSFFGKGNEIDKKYLIELWMAHNLITVSDGRSVYKEACRYIDDLQSRSFFEYETVSWSNDIYIKIHDLLFDVLQYISGYEFSHQWSWSSHVRHVRIDDKQGNAGTIDATNLRTLEVKHNRFEQPKLIKVSSDISLRLLNIPSTVDVSTVDELLVKSKLLRFLDISDARIIQMPESLFELYNLIYLNLCGCRISELSESISNLINLRHLDVSYNFLERIPDGIVELTNLRSLYIQGNRLSYMPRGLSRLKGLQELNYFVTGRTDKGEPGLQELVDLVRHHPIDCPSTFGIYGLQNVRTEDAIEDDILLNITCRHLFLCWSTISCHTFFFQSTNQGPEQEVVLNKLRPHSCIKGLKMEKYEGSNLPAWMGSLVNLVHVTLNDLVECTSISCLWELPSLELLDIRGMSSLREVVSPVQSLSGSDDHILSFPKLTKLNIHWCSAIICIPLYRFPALTHLHIDNCSSLQFIEFSGSQLECRPDGSTSSIQEIEIKECDQIQYPSEMAVPRSLEMLHIYHCAKLSGWVRSNRSTILRDVPKVELDGKEIVDLACTMEDVYDLYEYQLIANQISLQHGNSQDEKYIPRDKRFDIDEMMMDPSLGEGMRSLLGSFSSRPPTGSLLGSKLMGRKDEIEELLQLLQPEHGDLNVEVIALVGIGGVGKTSLAQHAFQHFKGTEKFDTMAWVFVSEGFDLISLARAALTALTKAEAMGSELSVLEDKLQEVASGKKFFLVMDDIRYGQWKLWNHVLFSPFLGARGGSKILITTRDEDVARKSGEARFIKLERLTIKLERLTEDALARRAVRFIIKLGRLSEEDGWSLFQHHAFQTPNEEHPQVLIDIGKDIVKKCGGLPLAIKVLGTFLRDKNGDPDEWMHVSKAICGLLSSG